MNNILNIKTSQDDFEVEYEVYSQQTDNRVQGIEDAIREVDDEMLRCQQLVDKSTNDIERLTNRADGIDYIIAVLSGVLTGLIDSLFVGEWNLTEARTWSSKEVNRRITDFAKKDPEYFEFIKKRKNREDSSLSAIEFLERKYQLPGDNDWNTKVGLVRIAKEKGFAGKSYEDAVQFLNATFPKEGGWAAIDTLITPKTHHLDDLCHHPTVVGLICCIIVQFTRSSIYSNRKGDLIRLPVTVNKYGKFVGNNELAKIFSGVINWFFNCAQVMACRKGHLFSDMAGSFSSQMRKTEGMGLPGSFLSTMKELAALPIFHETNFAEKLRKAYQNGIGTGSVQLDLGAFNTLFDGAKLDMRTEMAVGHELKKQALPIVINEALVRGAYFVRRFIDEIKVHQGISGIEWKNIIPFNNRTIARMMTIASGTFTAVDLGDAIIRSGGVNAACLLRVNFVGVGRFAIALSIDAGMGAVKAVRKTQRMQLYSQMISLSEAKVFYKEQMAWCAAEDVFTGVLMASRTAEASMHTAVYLHTQIESDLDDVGKELSNITESDPALASSLLDQLLFD